MLNNVSFVIVIIAGTLLTRIEITSKVEFVILIWPFKVVAHWDCFVWTDAVFLWLKSELIRNNWICGDKLKLFWKFTLRVYIHEILWNLQRLIHYLSTTLLNTILISLLFRLIILNRKLAFLELFFQSLICYNLLWLFSIRGRPLTYITPFEK